MLETQPKWYIPAPKVLGWHIGLWNLIGAIGFTVRTRFRCILVEIWNSWLINPKLCGALGPAYGNSDALYEASLATFWGSWAFLLGSVIQWYEALDKFVVEVKGKDP